MGARPHRYLVSTRGPSASHVIFGLESPPRTPSRRTSVVTNTHTGDAEQMVGEGEEYDANTKGVTGVLHETREHGNSEGGDGLTSSLHQYRLGGDRRSVLTERLSCTERWTRLPNVAQASAGWCWRVAGWGWHFHGSQILKQVSQTYGLRLNTNTSALKIN